ncbi:hypothetical protein L596_009916 [Steinernema carpocapsae]|uniref:Uncharacterized protein n=1 Tax=Steinernema carpocapsae TaxID=34508 RepID=A0A4U5PGR0_STECR|nr:hypothetical protein L596_009916 [Steinernema carpocapsae]
MSYKLNFISKIAYLTFPCTEEGNRCRYIASYWTCCRETDFINDPNGPLPLPPPNSRSAPGSNIAAGFMVLALLCYVFYEECH